MKRWAVLILLLVVAGAIVNVAVAWGFAITSPFRPATALFKGRLAFDDPYWRRYTYQEPGKLVIHAAAAGGHRWLDAENKTPAWSATNVAPTVADVERWKRLEERAFGWPAICLRAQYFSEEPNREVWVTLSGIRLAQTGRPIVPRTPIWPGFAINTLFYAAILWLLFAAPFALRRRRRIKRGLCPKCAYPVGMGGTTDVCTECGAAVHPLVHGV